MYQYRSFLAVACQSWSRSTSNSEQHWPYTA